MMSWIKVIGYAASQGKLRRIYDRVSGPKNHIDNILTVHSLRPHTLTGHMQLYKNVLHHQDNTLPKWYLETIGIYVSALNNCSYCFDHHSVGLKRLLESTRFNQIVQAIKELTFDTFSSKHRTGLEYARQLTVSPHQIKQDAIEMLSKVGFTDGEILEINQVTAYFNYANRTVLGLGVSTLGEEDLGLSPSGENEDDWGHG